MGFRASLSSGRLADPPAPTPAVDLTALVLAKPGAAWWDKESAYVHLTGGAADTWTDRVRGITITDGGSAARRPAYDATNGLTFNGTTWTTSPARKVLPPSHTAYSLKISNPRRPGTATAESLTCDGTGTNEVLAQMGTNDWVLYAAQYLDASDFRTKMGLFWSSFSASAPPGTAYFLQTIGPRTFGVPSSLGTVVQCRTAEIGAFSDICLPVVVIDGATVYTLAASPDNLHPFIAQQILYGPIERAGMGTW